MFGLKRVIFTLIAHFLQYFWQLHQKVFVPHTVLKRFYNQLCLYCF